MTLLTLTWIRFQQIALITTQKIVFRTNPIIYCNKNIAKTILPSGRSRSDETGSACYKIADNKK